MSAPGATPSDLLVVGIPNSRAAAAPPGLLEAVARAVLVEVAGDGRREDVAARRLLPLHARPRPAHRRRVAAVDVLLRRMPAGPRRGLEPAHISYVGEGLGAVGTGEVGAFGDFFLLGGVLGQGGTRSLLDLLYSEGRRRTIGLRSSLPWKPFKRRNGGWPRVLLCEPGDNGSVPNKAIVGLQRHLIRRQNEARGRLGNVFHPALRILKES